MNSNDTGSQQDRRGGHGGRRSSNRQQGNRDRRDSRGPRQNDRNEPRRPSPAPRKPSLWQRIVGFFTGGKKKTPTAPSRSERTERGPRQERTPRTSRPVETVEVTTPKLYVGNLSYDATEGDLHDLFNGVGKVQNAEIVTLKGTYKSKGFGFVTMITVDEAKRAVETLHDKPFMGRKLVVSGSKAESDRDAFDTR